MVNPVEHAWESGPTVRPTRGRILLDIQVLPLLQSRVYSNSGGAAATASGLRTVLRPCTWRLHALTSAQALESKPQLIQNASAACKRELRHVMGSNGSGEAATEPRSAQESGKACAQAQALHIHAALLAMSCDVKMK